MALWWTRRGLLVRQTGSTRQTRTEDDGLDGPRVTICFRHVNALRAKHHAIPAWLTRDSRALRSTVGLPDHQQDRRRQDPREEHATDGVSDQSRRRSRVPSDEPEGREPT